MTKRRFLTVFLILALALSLAFGLLFLGVQLFVHADLTENNDISLRPLDDKSAELNNGYLDRYGIPTSQFTYTNNGDAESGAPLSYAFDRNFNSVWRSLTQTKADDPTTINTVTVTFETPYQIDRIVYQADSSWYDRGYFNTLTLSYVNENNVETKCAPLDSEQTNSIVLVTLKHPAVIKSITLEWTKVPTNHRTVAAASEIIFLQPQSSDVENVQNMFTDYAQLQLNSNIHSKADVEALREKVKGYASYDEELSYLLTRAEQVLEKTVFYEARREMGTSSDSPNVITQHGDVAGYARSQLKFAWFGTNRQATGVSVAPGDDLIVYVTGKESDPLPYISYSQHWGSWRAWKSGDYKLHLGKNVIKVQNYLQSGYTTNTGDALAPGGPVYIVNPYTEKEQSSEVKVYIEGGDLFPLFRENGDVKAYERILKDYAEEVAKDRERGDYKVVDVTEIVSDRVILTVRASLADTLYNENGYDPQTATETWDTYVDGILQFDGVVLTNDKQKLDEIGAKYDERNSWLNVNIRLMQPFGAAYAHIEHVGIQVSWEATAITATSTKAFGWGYTHEIGHMLDIGERTVSECSNNMVSKYHETVIERTAQRGDFQKTTDALAPDDHIDSYWNTNRGNFIFWWLIESYYPGFWAKLENRYRYEDVFAGFGEEERKSLGSMNATEKQVYLSSLVVGEDLSHYFERWGYNLSTNDYVFEAEGANTSEAFKAVMAKAKKDGRIKDGKELKFWYLDAAEWWARYPELQKTELYHGTETPTLRSVTRSSDGYNLIMDIDGAENDAHLGFEILEGSSGTWKVIGFTYDKMFLDAKDYGKTLPKYKVIAYDRALQTSRESTEKSPAASSDAVCKTTSATYASIYEAVAAAKDHETITLLKDTSETGIVIDKDITIESEGAHTITKGGPKPIFTVLSAEEGSGALTLRGKNGTLTLDGGNIATSESLVVVQGGGLVVENCTFTHNIYKPGTGNGGALRIGGGTASVKNSTFTENYARLGGGVYTAGTGEGAVSFESCTFSKNTAAEGGGYYNRGTVAFTDCTFRENTAETLGGGIANVMGGVIVLTKCSFLDNEAPRGGALYADGMATIFGGTMSGNTASEEGAAICYERSTNSARPLYVKSYEADGSLLSVEKNVCEGGAAVYLDGDTEAFSANVSNNQTLYSIVLGGVVKLSGGSIGGTVLKRSTATVSVEGHLPTAAGEKIVVLTDSIETGVLLFTANFDLAIENATLFETERGNAVVKNNKEIWLDMDSYTVVFVIGDSEEEFHYLPGHKLTLGASAGDFNQQTYVSAWTDGQNHVHQVGEEIEVNDNLRFVATVSQKLKVDFSIAPEVEVQSITYYVMPAETFTLPRIDPEKYVFGGWEQGGALHEAYETASVTQNTVYTARTTKKLVVKYAVRKNERDSIYDTRYYAYGSKLSFVSCHDRELIPEGGYVNGFFTEGSDGSLSSNLIDFDTYTVQTDLTLVADVVEIPVYISYSFTSEGGTDMMDEYAFTVYAPVGSTYTITPRDIPTGYHLVSQIIVKNGEPYTPIGDSGLDIDLTDAFYVIINAEIERDTHVVTYQINGTTVKTEIKKYGDTILLDDPTDTLLREALGEDVEYSFNSFQVVTEDPIQSIEDVSRTHEMNMMSGSELIIKENVTINMLVYIKGEEKAPEAPEDGGDDLALQRLEKKTLAGQLAQALIDKVNASDTDLTNGERSEIITEINRALSEVQTQIDGMTSASEMDDLIEQFRTALGELEGAVSLYSQKNAAKRELAATEAYAQKAFETVSEAEGYLAQIHDIVTAAEGKIDEAKTSEAIGTAVEEAKAAIAEIVREYGDHLTYLRESEKAAAELTARTAKNNVSALESLTEAQKNAYLAEIDASLSAAQTAIGEAGDQDDITAARGVLNAALTDTVGRATADNGAKADALAELRAAADALKETLAGEKTASCGDVDADKLLRNFTEVKDKISAFEAGQRATIDEALADALDEALAAEGSGETLKTALKGVTAKFRGVIDPLQGTVSAEAATLITDARQLARDEAVKNDAEPSVERLREELNGAALSDEEKDACHAELDAALGKARGRISAASTREEINAALDELNTTIGSIRGRVFGQGTDPEPDPGTQEPDTGDTDPDTEGGDEKGDGPDLGLILGIVIPVAIVAVAAAVVTVLLLKKRSAKK